MVFNKKPKKQTPPKCMMGVENGVEVGGESESLLFSKLRT